MDLDKLIEEGEKLESKAKESAMVPGKILKGIELETWASKAVIFMDEESENNFLTEKVQENAKNLNSKGYEKYHAILGVLKAIKESE
ncbi:hypothetical protein GCM10011409_00050 [Lentibacillus populi]|uniref:Uncharacterized protein n=1 Tax=Lentibacillus populi TaxID=1827502 RepID=A0A9W5TTX8_9BACI|nr:hypothetical protein [Lentibacillus populi]GGB26733.1 hypothetical protein GCM10011409_00050 [Lentibacillus populi]